MANLCIKTPSSASLVLIFQLLVLRPRPSEGASAGDNAGDLVLEICSNAIYVCFAMQCMYFPQGYWSFLISRVCLGGSIHVVFSVFYVLVQVTIPTLSLVSNKSPGSPYTVFYKFQGPKSLNFTPLA